MQLAAAALVSAALMWLAFPPVNLGFLVFVAPVPLLWALRRATTRREAAWVGLIYGIAFFGGMLWWIFTLGAVAWFPLVGAHGRLHPRLRAAHVRGAAVVLLPLVDGGRGRLGPVRVRSGPACPLGGFPWGAAGFPIGTIPGARGAAQWIGPTGWGVLVIGFAASLVLLAEEEPDRRPLEAMVAIILILSALGLVLSPEAGGPGGAGGHRPGQLARAPGSTATTRSSSSTTPTSA